MHTIISNYYSIQGCAYGNKKLDKIMYVIDKDIKQ